MSATQHPEIEGLPIDAAGSVAGDGGEPPVHSDPEIMSGTPVFVGTRVPVDTMFDYLAAGDSLNRFLRHFPSVNRDQAVEVIEIAREALLEGVGARPRLRVLAASIRAGHRRPRVAYGSPHELAWHSER